MFKILELSNFRGFADAKLAGLARVNLITGLNGSGKTSLLEAAFLISGAANAALAASLYGFRGESSWRVGADRPFRSLFRDLDPTVFPKIVASSSDLLKTSARYRRELTIKPSYAVGEGAATTTPSTILQGVTFDFVGPSGRAKGEWGWNPNVQPKAARPQSTKKRGRERKAEMPAPPTSNVKLLLGGPAVKNPDLIHGQFISPYVRDVSPSDYEMLTQLIKERRSSEAVEALRLVAPALSNLQPLSEGGEQVVYADVGGKNLLPVNLLGSGLLNCLRILLPSLLQENATILIDEFEDGLHHSLHGPLVETVVKLAHKRRNQLFITTHSEEFLRRFISTMKQHNDLDVAFFRLGKIGLRGLVPKYTLAEAEDLLDAKIDLR